MGSIRPVSLFKSALPTHYSMVLDFAQETCNRIVRNWPGQVFPVYYHSEQMGADAIKLGLSPDAVQAAITHDLPLMTDIKFDDLELLISGKAVDLLHEMAPSSQAFKSPDEFDLEAYLSLLSTSGEEVQTLALLDVVQTATHVGNRQLRLTEAYSHTLSQYVQHLNKASPSLRQRADFVEKWLKRRIYEKQVCNYKIEVPDIEYIAAKHP